MNVLLEKINPHVFNLRDCFSVLKVIGFAIRSYVSPSQLVLSQQLKKEYGSNVVPAFPPKKIFTLTPAEVEQRREQLEKYMQAGKLFILNGLSTDDLICISRQFGLNLNSSDNDVVFVRF